MSSVGDDRVRHVILGPRACHDHPVFAPPFAQCERLDESPSGTVEIQTHLRRPRADCRCLRYSSKSQNKTVLAVGLQRMPPRRHGLSLDHGEDIRPPRLRLTHGKHGMQPEQARRSVFETLDWWPHKSSTAHGTFPMWGVETPQYINSFSHALLSAAVTAALR
jgi:hypothetical protein